MSVKIGNAKYGGNYVKKKYWRLKDGESTYRILPPIGELADKGIWSQFYSIHYGYKNSEGKGRAFVSPLVKNRNTKMIEQPDAALDFINKLKSAQEAAKAAGRAEVVKEIGEKLKRYNLDNNHYVNAIDTQGNIGILKLRHRAKLALDATIKRLREQGVDPLSVEDGRFFVFRRSGNGLDTSFQVDILKEKLKVDGVGVVERDVVHKLTSDIVERLGSEAAELNKLFKRPTSEQVARMVAEGAKAVDEILDSNSNSSSAQEDDGFEEEGEYEQSTPAAAQQATVSTPVAQTQSAPAAQPVAQAPAAASTAAPKAESLSTPTKTTAQAISDQSDADFLKSLGLQG